MTITFTATLNAPVQILINSREKYLMIKTTSVVPRHGPLGSNDSLPTQIYLKPRICAVSILRSLMNSAPAKSSMEG